MKKIIVRVSAVVFLIIIPSIIYYKHYIPGKGFMAMIYFGTNLKHMTLPEVNKIDPPRIYPGGYDGQMYSQIALDPLLLRKDFVKVLDNPVYRARRIGLPLLTYIIGLGNPVWILHVYPLINFFFFCALLLCLFRHINPITGKDYALIFSIMLSNGVLMSLLFSTIDLSALVFMVYSVFKTEYISAILFGISIFFRETSILGFFSNVWKDENDKWFTNKNLIKAIIIIVPFALWYLYTSYRFSKEGISGISNFTLPFQAIIEQTTYYIIHLSNVVGKSKYEVISDIFELLALFSISIQALYHFIKPRFDSKLWRMSIFFAIMLFFLHREVMVNAITFSRVLLPLTIFFNLQIYYYEKGWKYMILFILGNIGMTWSLIFVVFFLRNCV